MIIPIVETKEYERLIIVLLTYDFISFRTVMLSNKFHRFSLFRLLSLVRQQSNIARDNNGYKSSTEKTILDQYLANITVTSFYCQSAIEQLALKVLFNSFLKLNIKFILQI